MIVAGAGTLMPIFLGASSGFLIGSGILAGGATGATAPPQAGAGVGQQSQTGAAPWHLWPPNKPPWQLLPWQECPLKRPPWQLELPWQECPLNRPPWQLEAPWQECPLNRPPWHDEAPEQPWPNMPSTGTSAPLVIAIINTTLYMPKTSTN